MYKMVNTKSIISRVIEGSDELSEDDREGLEDTLDSLEYEMQQDTLVIYRGMNVDDSKGVAKKIVKGEKTPGDFWAFMEESATSYVGGEGVNIVIEGRVSNVDVNWEETIAYNYKFPDESEICLDKGGEVVTVVRVKYEEWNEDREKNEWKTLEAKKENDTKSDEIKVKAHSRQGGKTKVVQHTRSAPVKDREFTLFDEGEDVIASGIEYGDNKTIVVYFGEDTWGILYKDLESFQKLHGKGREIVFEDYPVESHTRSGGKVKVKAHSRGEGKKKEKTPLERRKLKMEVRKEKFQLKQRETELKYRREDLAAKKKGALGEAEIYSMEAWVNALGEYITKLEAGEDVEKPDFREVTNEAFAEWDKITRIKREREEWLTSLSPEERKEVEAAEEEIMAMGKKFGTEKYPPEEGGWGTSVTPYKPLSAYGLKRVLPGDPLAKRKLKMKLRRAKSDLKQRSTELKYRQEDFMKEKKGALGKTEIARMAAWVKALGKYVKQLEVGKDVDRPDYETVIGKVKWQDSNELLQECVSRKLSKMHGEGKDTKDKQVQAIAFSMCRKKLGIKDVENPWVNCPRRLAIADESILGYAPLIPFFDHVGEVTGKSSNLKGVIKNYMILAREMVQDYHINEFPPQMRDMLWQKYGKDLEVVKVFKSYDELKKAISALKHIPETLYHTPEMFPGCTHRATVGAVKDLGGDDVLRAITGNSYAQKKKLPKQALYDLSHGKVIAVSIGGRTGFGPGGTFQGKPYHLSQINIEIGHLALLPGREGRCPAGQCGVNVGNLNIGVSDGKKLGHFLDMSLSPSSSKPRFYGLDPDFADLRPTIRHQSSLNKGVENNLNNGSNKPESQDFMTEKEIEKLLAENADLEKQVAALTDANYVKKVEELEAIVSTLETEKETLSDEAKALKTENEELEGTNKGLQILVDEMHDAEKARLIDALAGIATYKDEKKLEELKGETLAVIRTRFETLRDAKVISMKDEQINRFGFPKPSEEEMRQMAGTGNDKFRDELMKMGMNGEVVEND